MARRLFGGADICGLLVLATQIENGVVLAQLVVAFAPYEPSPLTFRLDARPEGFTHAGITKGPDAGSWETALPPLSKRPPRRVRPGDIGRTDRNRPRGCLDLFGYAQNQWVRPKPPLARRRLDGHRFRGFCVPGGGLERYRPARHLFAPRFPCLASHSLGLAHPRIPYKCPRRALIRPVRASAHPPISHRPAALVKGLCAGPVNAICRSTKPF
jgi:hypothetical protein